MRWSISIQLIWEQLPFADRARAAAAAGFELVDLWDQRHSDIDAVHASCREHGIGINGFFGTRDTQLCDAEARTQVLDEVKRNLEVAVRVGARQLHVFSNAIRAGGIVEPCPPLPRVQLLENCVERLAEMADLVRGSGVQLVLEHLNTVFLPGYLWHDVRTTAEIARTLDRQAELGVVFDTFHQQLSHGNLSDALQAALPVLSRIDLAQVPGRYEPGNGELNLGFVLDAARRRGWDGTVTFECVPSDGNPAQAVAAIRALIAEFTRDEAALFDPKHGTID